MELRENSVMQSEWSVNIPGSASEQNVNQSANQSVNLHVSQNVNQGPSQNVNSQREGYNWNSLDTSVIMKSSSSWVYKDYLKETEKKEEEHNQV